jgi:hypothetical protein
MSTVAQPLLHIIFFSFFIREMLGLDTVSPVCIQLFEARGCC